MKIYEPPLSELGNSRRNVYTRDYSYKYQRKKIGNHREKNSRWFEKQLSLNQVFSECIKIVKKSNLI